MLQKKQQENRRYLVAVIGEAAAREGEAAYALAEETGRLLVDSGLRVCSGGMGGVMHAAFRGAKQSDQYRESDTVAIIPFWGHIRNSTADLSGVLPWSVVFCQKVHSVKGKPRH